MNNFEIGIDIEKIKKFANKKRTKHSNFLSKIFTKKELKYCFSKKNTFTHLAGRFAAKEAILKATSSINKEKLSYNQIEILNKTNGTPYVILHVDKLKKLNVKISISHDEGSVVAIAIVYT